MKLLPFQGVLGKVFVQDVSVLNYALLLFPAHPQEILMNFQTFV